ncbi:MAG: CvpA family protein [Candidatus Pseudobacter hemicellulosilyticus]|uniref:CvpA family protein n=1 Tax=Candidatus Pseudobacter hemicellulosilyticus TaxID=3121375 RepID=A0AAJ5WTC8_9BACT|nr:MAG: CvpA family protein [Pseudobacter sp.]
MIIDLLYLLLLVLALIRGWQRGLIIAVFSVIGLVIGLAAAMKLSTVVADYLKDSTSISAQWLPFLSFAAVFLVVVLLIRWGANLLEATMEVALMGWVNKLGGILLYIIIYTLAYSVLLFFAEQLKLVEEKTITDSVCWPYVRPLGPKVIDGIGKLLPFFKDMFAELTGFFASLAERASAN